MASVVIESWGIDACTQNYFILTDSQDKLFCFQSFNAREKYLNANPHPKSVKALAGKLQNKT